MSKLEYFSFCNTPNRSTFVHFALHFGSLHTTTRTQLSDSSRTVEKITAHLISSKPKRKRDTNDDMNNALQHKKLETKWANPTIPCRPIPTKIPPALFKNSNEGKIPFIKLIGMFASVHLIIFCWCSFFTCQMCHNFNEKKLKSSDGIDSGFLLMFEWSFLEKLSNIKKRVSSLDGGKSRNWAKNHLGHPWIVEFFCCPSTHWFSLILVSNLLDLISIELCRRKGLMKCLFFPHSLSLSTLLYVCKCTSYIVAM